MKDAMFKHAKTDGIYTVVAKVTASISFPVKDMQLVGVRKTDHGWIAVVLPNLGLAEEYPIVTAQGTIENGDDCVLYRGTNGSMWLRKTSEFIDGRFVPLSPRAACMMPTAWHLGAQMGS